MSSWKSYKLGDIAEITSSKRIFYSEYVPSGIPFWRSKEIIEKFNRKNISTDLFISNEKYQEIKSKFGVPQQNDILLTSVGTLGIPYLVQSDEQFYFKDGNLTWIKNINNELLNPLFLFKWLASSIGRESLSEITIGSTQEALTISGLKTLELLLPPLEEQKAIAEVLSSFDDKIDLLHRQNQTLESLAQTLFRQWFIEEAKEEWEEIKLGDFVDCITGYSYKSDHLNDSNNALVTLKNFARDGSFRLDGFKEFTGTKYKDSQIVKHGDLVVSHTDITQEADIIGNPVLVVDMGRYDNLIITMDLMKVESKVDWLSKEFLYYLFRTEDFKFHCLGNSNGTTVLHMSRKTIPEYKIKIPNIKRIEDFTNDVKEILQKQYVNILQIQTLENLRDTLLPKLLSGEVRI